MDQHSAAELSWRLDFNVQPDFYVSGDGMLEVIEKMRKRGFDLQIDLQSMEMGGAFVEFTEVDMSQTTRIDLDAYRLPEAVAMCALRALQATNLRSADTSRR